MNESNHAWVILSNLYVDDFLHAGFEVAEILKLLDRFCEEKMYIAELEKQVESGRFYLLDVNSYKFVGNITCDLFV